ELIRESVRAYLMQKLSKVESEIFLLAKKYGVKDVFELDSRVKAGFVSEGDAYDDYFAFDSLEADRDKLKKLLKEI
ncbi:MAG: hypothetical protein U9R02_06595, partial [Thermodesulfobacteriota bacterium]|nr:hypothetical protein [Thermodesulfobacteriota bacterium]